MAFANLMRDAIETAGLPRDCVQLVEDTTRASAADLMTLDGYLDALIPRGGKGLIRSVVENASVPVIETGAATAISMWTLRPTLRWLCASATMQRPRGRLSATRLRRCLFTETSRRRSCRA